MDVIFELLFGWWWHAKDGKRKTADAGSNFVQPFLLLVLLVALIALAAIAVRSWR